MVRRTSQGLHQTSDFWQLGEGNFKKEVSTATSVLLLQISISVLGAKSAEINYIHIHLLLTNQSVTVTAKHFVGMTGGQGVQKG